MICACNYAWTDPRERRQHGLLGGEALSKLALSSGAMGLACFDESNAFSSVLMPEWAWEWQACPALPACLVWDLLDE